MKQWIGLVIIVAIAGAVFHGYRSFVAVKGTQGTNNNVQQPIVSIEVPELTGDAVAGKTIFAQACATCHGVDAVGNEGKGPPLVHVIYESGHHGDAAFFRAVELGVRGHHWRFGDMAPVEGIIRGEVAMIIEYIRQLQRANGIR